MFLRFLAITAIAMPGLHAGDGAKLFTTYCSACHGPKGEGAMNGQFPPLAGSPWPVGNPDRAIKIVLNGLQGPVEINGKSWNLEMPPQGAVLSDDQIADILTYVRSSWGNKAAGVDTPRVTAVRAAIASRKEPWTAPAILELHPLEVKPPIPDLISYLYDGDWKELPDFKSLKGVSTEDEQEGIISLKKSGRSDHFGMVWEGTLELPADSDYEFNLAADDGARVILDGKTLVEVNGIGPMAGRGKQGAGKFKKGPHKLRVEFFEATGEEGIQLAWRKKGDKGWQWLTEKGNVASPQGVEIPIEPTGKMPAVYRNFIKGASPRGIGIGLPGEVNFVWSGDNHVPELIWTGKFMNGAHHWTDRGEGFEPPAGERAVVLSNLNGLALTSEITSSGWPKETKLEVRSKGYQFDRAGVPTFATQIGEAYLLDTYATGEAGKSLKRTIRSSGTFAQPVALLLVNGIEVKAAGPGKWTLPENVTMEVKGGTAVLSGTALYLKPSTSPVTITYTWN